MAAKTKAAAVPAREVKAAALARYQARRRAPEYRTAVGAGYRGTDMRVQVNADLSEYMPALDLGQWCDDLIVRLPTATPYDLVIRVLGALREGEGQALAVLGEAARLRPRWNQWVMYTYLAVPQPAITPPAGVHEPLRPLLREWQRLGLPTTQPDEEIPVRTLNQAELDASDARRKHRRGAVVPAGRLPGTAA
jgi:hypothetical protein